MPPLSQEAKITLILESISKDNAKDFGKKIEKNLGNIKKGFLGFNQVMSMNQDKFRIWNNQGAKGTTIWGGMANRFRMATAGLRGFRMEMLGVMFFGMAMQRMFTALLRPAADVFGIFDLFSTMLMIIFLPIMQLIFPLFMKMFNWFIDISPGMKMFLGIFALVGLALGLFLYLTGATVLGLGSLTVAWGFLTTVMIPFILTVLAITMAIYLLVKFFEVVKGAFKTVGGVIKIAIAGIMTGVALLVTGVAKVLNFFGLMSDETAKEWNGLWEYTKELAKSGADDVIEGGKQMGSGFIKGIDGMATDFKSVFGMIPSSTKTNMDSTNTVVETGMTDMNTTTFNGLDNIGGTWSTFRGNELTNTSFWADDMQEQLYRATQPKKHASGGATYSGGPTISNLVGGGGTTTPVNTNIPGLIDTSILGNLHDFVWRAGSPPQKIDSGDNLVGTKGGAGGGVNISYTINGGLSGKEEVERMIRNANAKLVNDIQRLVGA